MSINEKLFEIFIVDRFLDFYNREKKVCFQIVGRRDNLVRNKATYDFHCRDYKLQKEMGIEIKRLIPKERGMVKKVENLFQKYFALTLKDKLKGTFALRINLYEFPTEELNNRKRQERIFNDISNKILSIQNNAGLKTLSFYKGLGLLKLSEEGSKIIIWPLPFATAKEAEIVKMLDKSLKKFNSDYDQNRINITLFLELSQACRNDISETIKFLEKGIELSEFGNFRRGERRDFSNINEICYIALWNKTAIARVYPHNKKMKSVFFAPTNFMNQSDFSKLCKNYFL